MTLDEIIAEKLQRVAGAKLVELVCQPSGYEAIVEGGDPLLVCGALTECSPCNFVGTSYLRVKGRFVGFSRPGNRLEKILRFSIHDETVIRVTESMGDTVKRLADQVLAKPFVDFTPSTPTVCADCMGSGWLRSFTGAILGPERRCPCTPDPSDQGPEKWTVVERKEKPPFPSRVTLRKGSKEIQFTVLLRKNPCETTIHPTGAHSQVVVRIRGEHCKEMVEARLIEGLNNGTIHL